MRLRRFRFNNGMAMALTLMVASIILVLAMGMSTMAQQNLNLLASDAKKSNAYYSAVAGCNVAIRQLRASSSYTGVIAPTANGVTGSFTVTVTSAPGTAPDGTAVATGFKYILATGYDGTAGPGPGVASTRVGMMIATAPQAVNPPFPALAGDSIQSWDAIIDSYNSTDPSEPTNRALIATNSTYDGAIDFKGATVYGNVETGVGSNPANVVEGGTYLPGSGDPLSAETARRDFGVPIVPSSLESAPTTTLGTIRSNTTLTPGKYNALDVAMNKTVTFAPGDYYFTGDITTKQGVVFKSTSLTAGVNIYVDGKVTLDKDNQVNMTAGSRPIMFNLLSTGASSVPSDRMVQGDKNLQARMTVYAPSCEVWFHKTSEVWGAVVGQQFHTNNAGAAPSDHPLYFHYDTSLLNQTTLSVQTAAAGSQTSWRRD